MKLEQPLFNQIIESIPPINVNLEWSGEEGQLESEDHEILTGKFNVFANVSVYESITIDRGDYMTPLTCESNGVINCVEDPVIVSEDEEFELSSEQQQFLIEKIESLIHVEN